MPDLSHKRPLYYVLEGKSFTFTTEEARIRVQINLLTIFLKSGGQLWALEDYWTQVGLKLLVNQHRLPILIGVLRASLLVIFDFLWDFFVIVVFDRLVNLWALRLLVAHHFVLVGHKVDVVPLF